MKNSYWTYWIIVLGIFVVGVMMLINSTTTTSTQDYYALKEVTQAAMIDAIDYSYFLMYGDIKMSKEKFEENFIRRWAESASLTKAYDISFYDIYEVPPKVSVKVSTKSNGVNIAGDVNEFDVVNTIDVILLVGTQKAASNTTGGVTEKICNMIISKDFTSKLLNPDNHTYDTYLGTHVKAWVEKWSGQKLTGTSYAIEFDEALSQDYPGLATMEGNKLQADAPLLYHGIQNGDIVVN